MREHKGIGCHGFSNSNMPKCLRITGWVAMGLTMAVVFALVFAFLVQWLWNHLLPDIFGVKMITYWQAVGLIILTKLLFGVVGPHHRPRRRNHPRHWKSRSAWCRKNMSYEGIADEDWRYYEQYWQEQGKAAFEAYVQTIKQTPPPQAPSAPSADMPGD
jgi:hypothetical protein